MRLPLPLLLLAACAGARPSPGVNREPAPVSRPAPPPDDAATAARLRASMRDVLAAQGDALWKAWTEGTPAELESAWSGHEELLRPESVAAVRRAARAAGDPALARLAAFLAAEQIAAQTRAEAQGAAEARDDATFPASGEERPLSDLQALLAAEPDAARRLEVHAAALEKALPAVAAAESRLHAREDEVARSLGWAGATALALDLRGAHEAELRELAAGTLAATRAAAGEALEAASQEALGTGLAAARRADVPRLLAPAQRTTFPRGGALPAVERTLSSLGLPLRGAPGLTLLDGPTPHKDPRAACFPVRVPGDVRLSVLPQTADWPALLRETAAAVRLLVGQGEVIGPGGGAAGEAFAALFERLAEDEGWLRANTALTGAEIASLQRAARLRRLWAARRASAHVEVELGRAAARDPGAAYAAAFAAAELVQLPADHLDDLDALDRDPFLASADLLRGQVLAAMMERRLRQEHGPQWWSSAAAGARLRSWFARADATAADLLRALGAAEPDPSALVDPRGAGGPPREEPRG